MWSKFPPIGRKLWPSTHRGTRVFFWMALQACLAHWPFEQKHHIYHKNQSKIAIWKSVMSRWFASLTWLFLNAMSGCPSGLDLCSLFLDISQLQGATGPFQTLVQHIQKVNENHPYLGWSKFFVFPCGINIYIYTVYYEYTCFPLVFPISVLFFRASFTLFIQRFPSGAKRSGFRRLWRGTFLQSAAANHGRPCRLPPAPPHFAKSKERKNYKTRTLQETMALTVQIC
jgi:hypothetical protein